MESFYFLPSISLSVSGGIPQASKRQRYLSLMWTSGSLRYIAQGHAFLLDFLLERAPGETHKWFQIWLDLLGEDLVWGDNYLKKSFLPGSVIKNLPAGARDAEDAGSIPGSERLLGEGNGNPLQYSCLEDSRNRGAWRATVHRVAKRQTQLSSKHLKKARSEWWGQKDWEGDEFKRGLVSQIVDRFYHKD